MNGSRRLALIAALITLICFFLPWVRAGIGLSTDAASGLDLAIDGHTLLWLVPALALSVLILGMFRIVWERAAMLFALSGTAGGCISPAARQRAGPASA